MADNTTPIEVAEEAQTTVPVENPTEDITKTIRLNVDVVRVRCYPEDGDVENVILVCKDEITNINDNNIVKSKDIVLNPWYLTAQLCECSNLYGMIVSTKDTLSRKDFSRIVGANCKFERTFHKAGDTYLSYDGEHQYEQDGFLFNLIDMKMNKIAQDFLMKELE